MIFQEKFTKRSPDLWTIDHFLHCLPNTVDVHKQLLQITSRLESWGLTPLEDMSSEVDSVWDGQR